MLIKLFRINNDTFSSSHPCAISYRKLCAAAAINITTTNLAAVHLFARKESTRRRPRERERETAREREQKKNKTKTNLRRSRCFFAVADSRCWPRPSEEETGFAARSPGLSNLDKRQKSSFSLPAVAALPLSLSESAKRSSNNNNNGRNRQGNGANVTACVNFAALQAFYF